MNTIIWNNLNDAEKSAAVSRRGGAADDAALRKTVADIIENVKQNGDKALFEYAKKFDGVAITNLQVTPDEFAAAETLDSETKNAIETAYANIKRFHELQKPPREELNRDGIHLWHEYRPIERVGLYVPGGTAPLVSTLLMLAIPAAIARCDEIIVTTPCNKQGGVPAPILYAAKLCGISKIFKIGGAGAVAALAYGTASVPKVDKIFGPGNKYVTQAKQQVAADRNGAALDMPAGPSEVLVIADETANPAFVASDLLAQAEHDQDAGVVLVCTSGDFANKVRGEIKSQVKNLSRLEIIDAALKNGKFIIAGNVEQALEISNMYAPEHLMLQVGDTKRYLGQIKNAGSVFIGDFSSEALGDYASGTNHVLPTDGYAKTYSGISVLSFMKAISFQEVSRDGLLRLAPAVEKLAELEGLEAHKKSIIIRKTCHST